MREAIAAPYRDYFFVADGDDFFVPVPLLNRCVAGFKPEADSKNYNEANDVFLYANLTTTTAHG